MTNASVSTTRILVTALTALKLLNPHKDDKRNRINSNKKHTTKPSKKVIAILITKKDGSLIAINQSSFVPSQKLNTRIIKRKVTTKERIEGSLLEALFCFSIYLISASSKLSILSTLPQSYIPLGLVLA